MVNILDELKKGNLITWFVLFVIIYLICTVIQTIIMILR